MSAEPPSSGHPTGPPSGPLSGGPEPPPSEPPGDRAPLGPSGGGSEAGGPGGGGPSGPGGPLGPAEPSPGDGPGRPWWRFAPRVAVIALVVAAAVVLAVVFTRPDGTSGSGSEVFLQAAGKSGPDPFTGSTAKDSSTVPETPSPTPTPDSGNVTRGVDGSAPGLYGGTRNKASCDVEKQISYLQQAPAKNEAVASVLGLEPSGVPAYLRSLTSVQLRMDTRVTNHGYRDGAATSYQAILQSGTAVLVDDRGVPRVRCACGNPLTPPVAQKSTPKRTGDSWPSFRPSNVVAVSPATQVINIFVLYDPDNGEWIERQRGDTGTKDKKAKPPEKRPTPSVSSLPPSCPPGETTAETDGTTKCATTSPATPSTPTPETTSPDEETTPEPEPEPETSEPPTDEPADSPPDQGSPEDPATGSEPPPAQ